MAKSFTFQESERRLNVPRMPVLASFSLGWLAIASLGGLGVHYTGLSWSSVWMLMTLGGVATLAGIYFKIRSHGPETEHSLLRHKRALETIGEQLTIIDEHLSAHKHVTERVQTTVNQRSGSEHEVRDAIDILSHNAEESSSSVLEMVAINNEVTENIHNLALSVQETTSAIEEMTFSVKEVAKNIEDLSTAAEETAASMNQMDASINQVEMGAKETARLSETVSQDAQTGVVAINQTMEGIDQIRESSRVASSAMDELGRKIEKIGSILNVIDDVAEQTNLLALNAAIIAAQAGEHGRGFAVVADEIKDLAERTGTSTKEIGEIIKGIQDESKRAVNVITKGVHQVDEGVRRGQNAENALRQIVDSASQSTLMIKKIAQATVEQAKGSRQVTGAISRIAETVQQIASATAQQAKGSEQIMKSAERMRVITQHVERSTEEQKRGGRQLTDAIEKIRDSIEKVQKAHEQDLRLSETFFGLTRDLGQTHSGVNKASQKAATSLSDGVKEIEKIVESTMNKF